jgi:hypothetical protein
MKVSKSFFAYSLTVLFFLILGINDAGAQMITGVWKGHINKKKTELKLIQNGDSLTGTSYYYESENSYRRYSIRGYFDANTNEVVWWDDQLLEEKTGKSIFGPPGRIPYLSSADFNCPGSGKMYLDGKAALKEKNNTIKGPVSLEKTETALFNDEWDFVIDNYTTGANDPYIIDSIASIASLPAPASEEILLQRNEIHPVKEPDIVINKPVNKPAEQHKTIPQTTLPKPEQKNVSPVSTIEQKFTIREKVIAAEIPLTGDSIELRFYDNAEIDGDSISLFLNSRMIFQHIRLTANAYTIKLPVTELDDTNELVMVAENLGSIPPNTSYMLAIVNNKRYEAMLKSTEETSALIRLVKK